MNKNEYVELFNNSIRGTPVNIDKIVEAITEYLEDKEVPDAGKIVQGLIQQPALISNAFEEVKEHMCKKYTICSVIFNGKILMYYD